MDKQLSLIEHLGELRVRIIVSLAALGAGVACSFPFAALVLKLLKVPANGVIENFIFLSPQEGFLIHMRIAFLCGLVVAMPVILYELWAFIAPAMETRLRRQSPFYIIAGLSLFIAGCLFAYFVAIPPALRFLLSFSGPDLVPLISAGRYISFVVGLIAGCGLIFQMPAISLLLTKSGIINARTLRKKYKYALVIILICAAIITPTADAFNMLILAVPMLLLYELSIWISFLFAPRSPRTQ